MAADRKVDELRAAGADPHGPKMKKALLDAEEHYKGMMNMLNRAQVMHNPLWL